MRRIGALDVWTQPIPECSVPLPSAGFHLVKMGSVLPFGRFQSVAPINRAMGLKRIVRKLRRDCPGEPIVLVVLRPDVITNLKDIPVDLRVYEIRDDYVAQARTPERAARLRRSQLSILNQADLVMAISERLVSDVSTVRPDCALTRTGVEFDLFSSASAADAPAVLRELPGPRIGLVGNLNDRVDWDLVNAMAERLPEVSIAIIGPVYHATEYTLRSIEKLARHKNVHMIGSLPQEQLPSAIAALDVGIIPYRMTPVVERINPLKFLQYLSAGKPVVTTPIPCIADHHIVASIESDSIRFVNAVRQACESSHDPEAIEVRRGFARRRDWGEVAESQLRMYRAALARMD
jgi:glycosyltransferase involved in cell wall biosynthesis